MKKLMLIILNLTLAMSFAHAESIVMTLSDYSTGNTAMYDIGSGELSDNVLPHYQDASLKSDGESVYILEARGADAISKYSSSSISESGRIYQYSTGVDTNPHDIVFVGEKAYVMLYDSPGILTIDPNAASENAFITGTIDISAWADTDGSPEAHMGFYYDGKIFVVLQMYDLNTYTSGTAVLIAVDPATDTIIDMDTETEGIQGIDLTVKNPTKGSLVDGVLYLGGSTYGVSDEGVISVDLADPEYTQVKLISEVDLGATVAGVSVFDSGYGLVYSYDANWNTVATAFNPADGELGDLLPVPDAGGGVVMDGGKLYIGCRLFDKPGMYIVDKAANTVIGDIFPTELPPYSLIATGSTPTSVADSETAPETFSLDAAFPNPFNPSTTISVSIGKSSHVTLDVYNVSGQKVDSIVNPYMPSGSHAIVWNAADMASGVYYIRASDGIASNTVKVTLLK